MIYTLDHLFLKELRDRLVEKILDEWPEKWNSFPLLESDSFEELSNHFDPFLEKLRFDIYESLEGHCQTDSERVKKTTSKPTLRRILLNKEDIASLQYNTRNTLAIYIGFDSWEHFIEETDKLIRGKYFGLVPTNQSGNAEQNESVNYYPVFVGQQYPTTPPIEVELVPKRFLDTWFGKFTVGLASLTSILVGTYLFVDWYKNRPFSEEQKKAVKFTLLETYDKANSCNVKVCYDVTALDVDSVTIEYGEDENFLTGTAKAIVDANYVEHYKNPVDTFTHQYNKPNVWQIKLKARGQVLKSITKIVYSGNEWTSWAAGRSNQNYWSGKVITRDKTIHDGILQLKREDIEKQGLDFYQTKHQINKDFKIDGDSTFIEALVKDKESEGGIRNYEVAISFIDSTRTYMNVKFVQDAVGFGSVRIAETNMPGSKYVMPFLDINLQDWRKIGIKLMNQKAYFFVDDKMIHQMDYKGSFTDLKGIKLSFRGCGAADWVRLSNSYTKKIVFYDDFDRIIPPGKSIN
jgi:hypothetical protein